eukprot:SAG11_NODE_76_length_18005_cov_6.523958_8_plen_177_part_00
MGLISMCSQHLRSLAGIRRDLLRSSGNATRVAAVLEAIAQADALHAAALADVAPADDAEGAAGSVVLRGVQLRTPRGVELLATPLSFRLAPSENLLVSGSKGVGKTALLRAITGLWHVPRAALVLPGAGGAGRVALFCVPQLPHLWSGTLSSQLAYPLPAVRAGGFSSAAAAAHLC